MGNDAVIELNVGKTEYRYELDEKERWQKTAQARLVDALRHIGNQAKDYLEESHKVDATRVFAAHDAIFLSAERGGGKTAFLHNIEKIWNDTINQENEKFPKIFFCDPIDPTLLVNNDNFANVVIAQLYNEVELKVQDCNRREGRESFFKKLQALASALAQTEEQSHELPGIDRIVGYRSGIQLEKAFHEYAAACVSILNVDAIAIRIDDVDMALRRAFDVLDVVRRLLSCPLIIPIVSGDEALFRPIVENHFQKGGIGQKEDLLDEDQAKDLASSYLTKIFPNQYRVSLVGLESLLQNMVIRNSEDADVTISMDNYFKKFNKIFCPFVNGQEGSYDRPKPTNPRQLVQMVRTFPPISLGDGLPKKGWYRYRVWAEGYHHGTAYVVADTEQQLSKVRKADDQIFRLHSLLAFSLTKQIESNTFWKSYDYYERVLNSFVNKQGDKWRESQGEMCDCLKNKKTYRAMPPVEFFFSKLVVPKTQIEGCLIYKFDEDAASEQPKDQAKHVNLHASMYLHNTYYGTSDRRGAQLFFGRAFELVVGSLLIVNSKNIRSEDFWKKYLIELFDTPPFHSIYTLAPTKMVGQEGDGDENESTAEIDYSPADAELTLFANEMICWESEYGEIIGKCRQEGLTHLFVHVMNKIFTQLHVMKEKSVFKDDTLFHAIARFEVVFINTIATFINPNKVVLEDVARTKTLTSLENLSELFQRTSALRVNVKDFTGIKGTDDIELKGKDSDFSLEQKLLKAIWYHPLFEYNINELTAPFLSASSGLEDSKILIPTSSGDGDVKIDALVGLSNKKISELSVNKCEEILEKASDEIKEKKIDLKCLTSVFFNRYWLLYKKYVLEKQS